MLLLLLLQHP